MIRFSLSCAAGHAFESWFPSDAAFQSLCAARMVTCPVCASADVQKALMAPAVRPARNAALPQVAAPGSNPTVPGQPAPEPGPLSEPTSDAEHPLASLRRSIEQNSDYVGLNFAAEARRIHDGDAPERAIYGEAKPEEARRLIEDGIPVAPLPFRPLRKVN